MTGFLKTAQSDLFIERQKQKALKVLGLEDAVLTEELVRKAFISAAKNIHPDSEEYNSENYFKPTLEDVQKARDILIEFVENEDGPN